VVSLVCIYFSGIERSSDCRLALLVGLDSFYFVFTRNPLDILICIWQSKVRITADSLPTAQRNFKEKRIFFIVRSKHCRLRLAARINISIISI